MTASSGPSRRILYITNGFPFPLTSGYLRHYFLIGELAAAGHRVVLLSVVGADHLPEHAAALADRTERVEVFRSLDRARGRSQRLLRRARRVLPLGGGEGAGRHLADRVRALRTLESFDAVVFSGKRTDRALRELDGLPVVVDMCDATSLRLERELAVAPAGRRAALRLQVRQVRATERRMLHRADRALFASSRDREALLPDLGPADGLAAIVPNGVDTTVWHRSSDRLGTDSIVFTGAMGYAPNVDAAVHLARTILPLVRRTAPDARLTIVGRDPAPAVAALASLDGVTVTGFVDDVRPYLDAASVFAAPLRFGAGIQNKLLEAMAMAVPSVVSSLAADGLRTAAGDEPPVVVADDPVGAAAAIIRALGQARLDPRPDSAARAYVLEHFSWRRSGAELTALIDAAITERQARSTVGTR